MSSSCRNDIIGITPLYCWFAATFDFGAIVDASLHQVVLAKNGGTGLVVFSTAFKLVECYIAPNAATPCCEMSKLVAKLVHVSGNYVI